MRQRIFIKTIFYFAFLAAVLFTPATAQTFVTIPADFNSEIGCGADWDPACTAADLTLNPATGMWFGSFYIPAGNWEYKVAIDHSWNENYGDGGVPDGANILLDMPAAAQMNFLYNPVSHIVTVNNAVYDGSLTLSTQGQVNTFNYTEVTGILQITGPDINNLNGLNILTTVGSWFWILETNSLTNLTGLTHLTSTGGIGIEQTTMLENIDALSSVTDMTGSIWIRGNTSLTNLDGLSGITLTLVGQGLEITDNEALTSIDGLSNLTSIGRRFDLYNNLLLTNINGLSNLTAIGKTCILLNNPALKNLDGFSSLVSVVGSITIVNNAELTNLDGLSSLTSVGGLGITTNPMLASFCGLYNVINNGAYSNFFTVHSNLVNPTIRDILAAGPCTGEELIGHLESTVKSSGLPNGIKNSLSASLTNAGKSLENGNNGAAINQLEAFIHKVEAQRGKAIDEATADAWIAAAQRIIAAIPTGLAKGNGIELPLSATGQIARNFVLEQNYPNPFNPSTSIRFSIPEAAQVQLTVYDINGREVRNLVSGSLAAGAYDIQWDATGNNGTAVASGIYIYRLQAGSFIQTRKMTLLR